jgi:hypothetical protein
MPLKDLTAYMKNDPNNRLVVSADTIDVTGLRRDEAGEVYFDYGFEFFDGDFTHRSYVDYTSSVAGHIIHWALANDAPKRWKGTATGAGITSENLNGIGLRHRHHETIDHHILMESDAGTQYLDFLTDAGYADPRYIEIYRVEGIPGPNGGGYLYADVYSDDTYSTLVGSMQLNLHNFYNFKYHYAVMPLDDNQIFVWTGTVGLVDLGITPPVISIPSIRTGKPVIDGQREPVLSSTEQITGLSAVKGLTVPAGTRLVVIEAETQAVRWRDDGTDPSATVGMPLPTGVSKIYTGDFSAIKFKEQTPSAKLNVSYYK